MSTYPSDGDVNWGAVLKAYIDARDAGKSDVGHTHDDRYYTRDEIDAMLAAKADTSHNHDDRYYTQAQVNADLADKSDVGHVH